MNQQANTEMCITTKGYPTRQGASLPVTNPVISGWSSCAPRNDRRKQWTSVWLFLFCAVPATIMAGPRDNVRLLDMNPGVVVGAAYSFYGQQARALDISQEFFVGKKMSIESSFSWLTGGSYDYNSNEDRIGMAKSNMNYGFQFGAKYANAGWNANKALTHSFGIYYSNAQYADRHHVCTQWNTTGIPLFASSSNCSAGFDEDYSVEVTRIGMYYTFGYQAWASRRIKWSFDYGIRMGTTDEVAINYTESVKKPTSFVLFFPVDEEGDDRAPGFFQFTLSFKVAFLLSRSN